MTKYILSLFFFFILFAKQSQNVSFDISSIQFEQMTSIDLKNDCNFYWKRFINEVDSNKTIETRFNRTWNRLSDENSEIQNTGYGSYAFEFFSDSARNDLAFELPGIYSNFKLFFNNELITFSGIVSASEDEAKPFWLPQLARLKIKAGLNSVVLHISNYSHNKGGPSDNIKMGAYTTLLNKQKFQIALDLFLFGILIITGLFIFGFYLFGQKEIHLVYFALFCISYSYRQIGYGDSYLHSAFQAIPWAITLRLEYISLCLTVFFFALYVYHLYKEDVHKYILDFLRAVSLLYVLIILVTPDTFFTKFVNYYLIACFFFICYGIYAFTKVYINKRPGAKYGFMSIFFVFTSFCLLIFESFFHTSVNSFLVFIGLSGFILCQVLILSHSFALFYKQALYDANSGLRAKSLFLATISHEIRNPLAAILGSSEVLEKTELAENQSNFVRIIKKSSQNLNVIISDILSLTKLEYSQVRFNNEELDLVKVVEDVLEVHYNNMDDIRNKIHLANFYEKNTKHLVIADNTRIKQILNNLIFNAIKFTKEGIISVYLRTVHETSSECTLEFRVADTGIGIAEEKLKSLFEQFSQVDSENKHGYGGLGLGLYICKVLVHKYNGKIWVESKKDEGSSFYFTIIVPKIQNSKTITKNYSLQNNNINLFHYLDESYQQNILENFTQIMDLTSITQLESIEEILRLENAENAVLISNHILLDKLVFSELVKLNRIKIILILKDIDNIDKDIKSLEHLTILREPIKLTKLYQLIGE